MQKRAGTGASLDDVIFHLLHRASQRADDIFAKQVGEIGLTARQFAVLLTVAESTSPSQTDIVRDTGIDRSTVADMVRRMARNGLLQRRRSREDARANILQLTEFGTELSSHSYDGTLPGEFSSTGRRSSR